jgi:serine/threonine-protein kinase
MIPAAGGRLQLLGEIARGGMGAILKGRDTDLGRDLAVKVLLETHQGKSELVRRFIEEAQIAGQLQHPGVAPIYELGRFADQRPYFTMKLLKGKTLAALLAARQGIEEERARFVVVFGQVCQTLAYAHARGVIHRDLKPSNVMVGTFGEVQVVDWGLAKVLRGVEADVQKAAQPEVSVIRTQRSTGLPEADSQTQAGSLLGTPAYMSPEQARGDVDLVDERADVFGLGAILCEILTGQPPFVGTKAEAARKAQTASLDDTHARLDRCGADGELVALAKRCLAAETWDRPRDAGKVAEEVTAYQNSVAERLRAAELAHAAEAARSQEARATAAQERRARRLTVALAASVLMALTLGAAGWRWVELDRIARAAALEARVNSALQETVRLRGEAQAAPVGDPAPWAEAMAAARKTEALLEPGIDPALRRQVETLLVEIAAGEQHAEEAVRAAERDRRLLDQLIDIRSGKADDRDGTATDAAYAEAFREAGLDIANLPPAEAGVKIRARPPAVALALAAAVDDWAAVRRDKRKDAAAAQRLSETARQADPDPWRKELRDAMDRPEKEARLTALRALARTARLDELSAISLDLLGEGLAAAGDVAAAVKVLREAQRRHPGDVWVNYDLAKRLEKSGRTEEAIRYYMAARAIRPETAHSLGHALEDRGEADEAIQVFEDLARLRPKNGIHLNCLAHSLLDRGKSEEATRAFAAAVTALREEIRLKPDVSGLHNSLGCALERQGKRDDSIAEYRQAMRLQPDNATPHYNLGHLLQDEGKHADAAVEYREAIRLDPEYAEAHVNLGRALKATGKLDDAIASLRQAIRVKPDLPKAHANLAWCLEAKANYDEAIAANREAIRCNPNYVEARSNLASDLIIKGQYVEALAQLREGREISSKRAGLYFTAARLRKAEEMVELDSKLPAFLLGRYKPAGAEKQITMAEVCYVRKLPRLATALYSQAFVADPKLANSLLPQFRFNAASAAALVGTVPATDEPAADDDTKTRHLRQARGWLRADLTVYSSLLKDTDPRARVLILERLHRWQADPNLAGIRDKDALEKLPEAERDTWRKLWADVEEVLKKAEG